MSKDFSKYAKIIHDFRGEVGKKDFESKFNDATKHISKTERFLLKMEIKRLAQPCTRLIDLRGLVDGECRSYEYNERPHYLDDVAIRAFEENVEAYQGYTLGVYEAVNNTENNFRVIYQRAKSGAVPVTNSESGKVVEKTQLPAKLYHFGPHHNRIEERMNFAITLEVGIASNKTMQCSSSDLSVNGCKFRLSPAQDIAVGQVLTIRFIGLEHEFEFGDNTEFSYEIRNIQQIDDSQLVGVERVYVGDKNRDSFRRFLAGYIQGNKRRYKINLDNSITALQSRTYEQYLLPKINELPVFLAQEGEQLIARYALTSIDNRDLYEYWMDKRKCSTFDSLFTPKRIARLLKQRKLGKSLIVYSFIHVNKQGQSYFYTADEKELAEDTVFMKQFIGFAASKKSFMVCQLSLLDVDVNFADSPFTLSESLTAKNAYLNDICPIDIKESLHKIPFIGVITDITDKSALADYQQFAFEQINKQKIKVFGHRPSAQVLTTDPVGISYNNHRKEPRFYYQTPVVVEIDNVVWQGVSKDFSISGMKVELNKSSVLMKGDIVYLTFPKLQKITSSFELKKLAYEVMRVNKDKTIINLRVYVKEHKHIGRSFFKLLIEKNKAKLTEDEYVMMNPGLAKSLRNIYSRSMLASAIMVQTSGSRYKYEVLTSSKADSPFILALNQLSELRGHYNLYPLLKGHITANVLAPKLKQLQAGEPPFSDTLYISIDPNDKKMESAVMTKLGSELASTKLKAMFIHNAMKKGLFFCIKFNLMRADKPDIAYLNPELSYISSYAIHRGKQLEQEIYSVAGMIQFYDITQEAMIRHNLARQ